MILSRHDSVSPPGETFRVLKEKELAKFGEYRTRRLVLEAWEAWERRGDTESVRRRSGVSAERRQLECIGKRGFLPKAATHGMAKSAARRTPRLAEARTNQWTFIWTRNASDLN